MTLPIDRTISDADLLFLPQHTGAPAVQTTSFFVANARASTATLRHADQFNTVFATLTFPAGSLASNGGTTVGAGDSVRVTVTASASSYRITVSPVAIEFSGSGPTLRFSAAVFGDFSLAGGASRFVTPDGYLAALKIWEELSPGRWHALTSNVDPVGTSVRATLPRGGTFSLAAER